MIIKTIKKYTPSITHLFICLLSLHALSACSYTRKELGMGAGSSTINQKQPIPLSNFGECPNAMGKNSIWRDQNNEIYDSLYDTPNSSQSQNGGNTKKNGGNCWYKTAVVATGVGAVAALAGMAYWLLTSGILIDITKNPQDGGGLAPPYNITNHTTFTIPNNTNIQTILNNLKTILDLNNSSISSIKDNPITLQNGYSAPMIIYLTSEGSLADFESWLDVKPNVNAVDSNGLTALMVAASIGDVDKIKVLLPYRPNLQARDKDGRTALDIAKKEIKETEKKIVTAKNQEETRVLTKKLKELIKIKNLIKNLLKENTHLKKRRR